MDYLVSIFIIGFGATAVMDAWGQIRNRVFGIATPDYQLVGRWIGHMANGIVYHDSIKVSSPIKWERQLGWIAHYLIGTGFASILIGVWGIEWTQHPTLSPALVLGFCTVVAPYFLMQPAMGLGIAGALTPNPTAARLQSLINHAVFGLGLYIAGWLVKFVYWA